MNQGRYSNLVIRECCIYIKFEIWQHGHQFLQKIQKLKQNQNKSCVFSFFFWQYCWFWYELRTWFWVRLTPKIGHFGRPRTSWDNFFIISLQTFKKCVQFAKKGSYFNNHKYQIRFWSNFKTWCWVSFTPRKNIKRCNKHQNTRNWLIFH